GDRFTEVVEEWLAAAGRLIFGIADHGIQMLDRHALLVAGLLIDEVIEFCSIRITIEQKAVGGQAIPSGASNLLIVPLDAFGEIEVNHKTNVGLVDAHPERNRSHDDLGVVAGKGFLIPATL